jgi:pimeloyl-ACP methyl ester carboxylesterase
MGVRRMLDSASILTRLTALGLLAGPALPVSIASAAEPAATPRFETATCPVAGGEPIPGLEAARCGYLIVPENRTKPESRTIRLAVAIVPAASGKAEPDPIVFMAGGPGEAAILDTPFLIAAGINRDRDLIVMTQRGTLFDEPDLNCPELDQYYARQVSLVYGAASTGAEQAAAGKACRDRLVAEGVDLSGYNTAENAADFADLRRALGIEAWNVYGYSYGSELVLSYLRDHPEGIRTVTVDSVVPPDIVGLTWTWDSARQGLTNVFAACAADAACAARYPDLMPTLTRVVQDLEANPLVKDVVLEDGKPPVKVILDGGTLLNLLVGNAIKPHDVPAAIHALASGRPDGVLAVRAAGAAVSDIVEQAQGMTQTFVCAEWEPYGAPADILAAGRKAFPGFPDSVLANAPQLPFQDQLCQAWDVPARPDSQRVRVESDVPALVVSGTFDAKTGAEWGRYAASTLTNSTYVTINGMTHWVIAQSPCGQDIFQSFLANPSSPDTSCAAETRPEPFTIDPN